MPLNEEKLKQQIQDLDKSLFEETFFKHDLRNGLKRTNAFINDESRKSLLELKGKSISIPEVKKLLKKELTRDILYVGSECNRLSKINIKDEFEMLNNVLDDEYLSIVKCKKTTISEIIKLWDSKKPEIIFFSCHGEDMGLYLQDEKEKCKLYSNLDFIKFFKKRSNYTECVILSSCESLSLAKKIKETGKKVIAINKKVDIKTATEFNKYFFEYINSHALGYSHVYKEAFDYSEEIIQFKGLKDSFAFEFLDAKKIG